MQSLINRVMNILLKPTEEWGKIKDETWTIRDLFFKHAVILAAIPAVAGFIGYALIGYSTWGSTIRFSVGNALLWGLLQYLFSLGGAFLIGIVMDGLAPSFGAQKDPVTSMKVVVFSLTASWVGGVLYLVPKLAILGSLLGIYSLVLMYIGMKNIRQVPADKLVGYFVTVLIVSIVLFILIGIVVSGIAMPSVDVLGVTRPGDIRL